MLILSNQIVINPLEKMKAILSFGLIVFMYCLNADGQVFSEILGRPATNSITISILFDQDVDLYFEYGTSKGVYNERTTTVKATKDVPLEIDFTGLAANTKYFYQTRYKSDGSNSSFLYGSEHTFQTPRPAGSNFTFAIEADPHLDSNSNMEAYQLTLQNIRNEKPDFLFDLGDTFMCEKEPQKNQTTFTNRHLLFRPLFGSVCHSAPLFLILGNHEGEQGWMLNGTANSNPVLITNTRKIYYPNPSPNSFYSGNSKEEPFVGLRENYYAFTWGDALFVVLDPYWYTLKKFEWSTTLGSDQYNWFRKTLSESMAKFKFVFCHNLVGGNGTDARGGIEYVNLFEMGGENYDGTWGFGSNRPEWGKPLHELMKENGVTVFFHGHDHFFGKQEKDGVIYQEVPQPSNRNITNLPAGQYGYVDGVFLPGRGFLRVSVSPGNVKIDYIRTYLPSEEDANHKNGEVAYSYILKTSTTSIEAKTEFIKDSFLNQNFPNPFNRQTTIRYQITKANHVNVKIYNVLGKEIATLVDQYQQAGEYSIPFYAGNRVFPDGMYYCRLTSGNHSESIKMLHSSKF